MLQTLINRTYKLSLIVCSLVAVQTYVVAQTVTTFAGNGTIGDRDGVGTSAQFYNPWGVATDTNGNVFVADRNNHKIRKITPTGVVSTFAGSGDEGSIDGKGTSASFIYPSGVGCDKNGNVYVTESNKIRKITPKGVVSTIAGSGIQGKSDGRAIEASFNSPIGLVIDDGGTIYVADRDNNRVRKISLDGVVSTLIGRDESTGVESAVFHSPTGIGVDSIGNIYISNYFNHTITKITTEGVRSIYAGTGSVGSKDGDRRWASFERPAGLSVDNVGNIYIADLANHRIRKIAPNGIVSTLTGWSSGDNDGGGTWARFNHPIGLTIDKDGILFVADVFNQKIRKITGCFSDDVKPEIKTKSVTLNLDINGQSLLDVSQIDDGSSDNCGIVSRTLSKTTFNCSDVGSNIVIYTVTDANSNSTSQEVTVTIVDDIAYAIRFQIPEIIRSNSDHLSTDKEYSSYQWYRNGEPIQGATAREYRVMGLGVYSVEVGDLIGCTAFSPSYTFGIEYAPSDVIERSNVLVYPNPTSGLFLVEFKDDDKEHTVSIKNYLGEALLELETSSSIQRVDIRHLPSGTYTVRVQSNSYDTYISLIKQ